jgi:hypothetical protein
MMGIDRPIIYIIIGVSIVILVYYFSRAKDNHLFLNPPSGLEIPLPLPVEGRGK